MTQPLANLHRKQLRLSDGDAFPKIPQGKGVAGLGCDGALVPKNLDLVPSLGKLSKYPLPQGISPPFPTYRWSHLILCRGKHSLMLSVHNRGQPLVSGVPKWGLPLSIEPYGSHLPVGDLVWRKHKELMRNQKPSPPAYAYGLESFRIHLSCTPTLGPLTFSGVKILVPPGAPDSLDGEHMPPFMGTEGSA